MKANKNSFSFFFGFSSDDLLGEATIPLNDFNSGSRQLELLLSNGQKGGGDATIVASRPLA